jgi:hypothetical protein
VGNDVGIAVENRRIVFIFIARESLGGNLRQQLIYNELFAGTLSGIHIGYKIRKSLSPPAIS